MAVLLYCPPNVTLDTVWLSHSFSPCFLNTLLCSVLGGMMFLFGNFELIMYYRFGSRIDGRMKAYTIVYTMQLCAMIMLMFIPAIYTLIYSTLYDGDIYGYNVFRDITSAYIWLMSIILVRLERNFDLPTTPVRGHSLFLIIFWTLALLTYSLFLIDTSASYWEMKFSHVYMIAGFCLFLLEYGCVLCTFILGLQAPGRPSLEQRFQFEYKKLPNTSKYGATDEASLQISLDIDLASSMDILKSQLQSGEAVRSFDRLAKQKANLRMTAATRPENRSKNRYLNILPYDATRVVLQESPTGSTYVNANRLIMNIPSSEIAKNYIVTQGPLPGTAADFWQLVFENLSGTIIMLTDTVEGGMHKCHKYWPSLNEYVEYGKLVISCIREDDPSTAYFVRKPYILREFSIIHMEREQELSVTQFQFTGWPDHGVPKRQQQFIDFMFGVLEKEPIQVGPSIVHCSAGIGRSGVYILVNTALALMECGQPVRPLELVRLMREQRPGMVQTSEQYIFACEVVVKLYERLVKGSLPKKRFDT